MTASISLSDLGWRPFFQQQLTLEEFETLVPARIIEQHKSIITVASADEILPLELHHSMPAMVVGDWILLDKDRRFIRLLDRLTCFKRKAAGDKLDWQLISANVDTAFILSSANEDFNPSRIERYLALVNEAGAEGVIVISKSDLAEAPEEFVARLHKLDSLLCVETINCLDPNSVSRLKPWLKTGSTVVVLGSSGVGKSTLVNTLLGVEIQQTAGIREDDAKGRHTTTRRSLIAIPGGGMILDTPGMREIQLADSSDGIARTFSDIELLARQCRYQDCQHRREPGCAVKSAIESGKLEQRRLDNYHKLLREEASNSASLAEKRAKDKALGKFYKRIMSDALKLKGR